MLDSNKSTNFNKKSHFKAFVYVSYDTYNFTIQYDSYDTYIVLYDSWALTICRYDTELFTHDLICIVRYWQLWSLYLYPPSFICFVSLIQERSRLPALPDAALILQRFLSVFFIYFFFLTWFLRALWTKFSSSVFHSSFSSRFGETKFVGPGEKIFPGFSTLPIFLSFPNSGKHCFPLYVFHPP